jgi:diguanylate cyclase (GGDEF)-like protein/PAS domain S-box-containing protein
VEMKENKKSEIRESEMMNALMDSITDSIYFKDLQSRFILINKACAKKFGIEKPDNAVGKTDFDFFSKEHAKKAYDDEQRIIKTKKPIVNIEEKETWHGKDDRWASTTKMPFYSKKGEIIGTFGISRDITEKKKAEEEIEGGKSKIEAILHSTLDGIYVTDKQGKVLMYNNRFLSLWKISKKLIKQETDEKILDLMNNQVADSKKFLRRTRELYDSEQDSIDIVALKNRRFFECSSAPLKSDDRIMGRVWSYRDITEQKKAEEKIWYLSFHDKLTGLYNRAFFEEELKRLNTKRQLPLSIIFCDLNRLKEINDNFGYERGDLLLRKFAEVLKSCFRNEDVVVRWGGDEFIMVLPNTDEMDVENVTKRIQLRCQQNSRPNLPMSAAIGSDIKTRESQNIDLVVSNAEKRMIANKKAMKTEA